MGAGVPQKTLNAAKRRLEKKTGKPHVILRASNGECAVVSQEFLDECRNWRNPQQNPPGGRPESWGKPSVSAGDPEFEDLWIEKGFEVKP
jgi:hypothetical protein